MAPRHALDVLVAFRMDVTKLRYENWDDVIHYCRYSAMPVGRFMLDVHGESTSTWAASDALCAGLQINNHLQDCGKDYRNLNRVYLPRDALAASGATVEMLGEAKSSPALLQCLHALAVRTETLLDESKSLSAEVKDFRLGLEICRDPGVRRQDRRHAEGARSAERARASEPARTARARASAAWPARWSGARRDAGPCQNRRPAHDACRRRRPTRDYGTTASGSSFYAAMRILPREQREAMFQIYSFCRQVDDIADSDGPRPERLAALQQWRDDIDALYHGHPPPRLHDYAASVENLRPQARGFSRHRRRHGDGRAAGYPRAGSCDARSLLRPRRQRRRTAVGAGVRPARGRRHPARPSSRPRAATDQHPARHRRGRRPRPALSAARRPAACRHHHRRSAIR